MSYQVCQIVGVSQLTKSVILNSREIFSVSEGINISFIFARMCVIVKGRPDLKLYDAKEMPKGVF